MAVSHADPSEFAVGSAHVLDSLAKATRSPAAAVLLVLPVLAAYLVTVTLAFAVRVAADACSGIVVASSADNALDTVTRQAAAEILGWLARLAVPALLFGGLSFACALLKFSSG